ncbi:hypothetical protein M3204_14030 [Mesobacillus subterraneus]|uniref:hypothetical protein n=1 Tax=Mesobacillus subterraneus TaxID=285983 RepID=UPI00203F933E|nr:hypothetical protein [Mesobacillus subterraneus]MCM3665532.1 hypothetical protein [Mesobacillus subterraneus]MCM3686091.1 hypothetical protein [Mesobacillus subterraneus]
MGLLFAAAMAEQKKQFIIERLNKRNIFETQQGKSLYEADYEELKYELVLSEFKEIDISADANKFF